MEPPHSIETFIVIQFLSNFVIYTSSLLVVLCQIGRLSYFQMSSKIILATFLVYFLFQGIIGILPFITPVGYLRDKSYYILATTIVNRFKWFIVYFFVIEVNSVLIKLRSKNSEN
jgi:hypothetical protein